MKGLKFRIWIKDEERYYDESDEESYEIIPNGNVTYTSEAYEEGGMWFTDTTSATRDVIVEQYTGLKDKNGKEIYEGDIVDVSSVFVKPKKMVVEFSKMACGFEPFVNGCSDCYSPVGKDVEVIGNIHENPELLEEEE